MKWNIKKVVQGDLLLGGWLRSNVLLGLFIVFLFVLYITNRYNSEGTVKDIEKCSKDIKQLHQQHIMMKTRYQNSSMMLVLSEKLEPVGVSVSKEPIKEVIFISK